ncbi:uncharacterized protein LOC126737892 [Anthonomus grandis grandis]|uniref:uncharacterized protein LOC126737892 n=1 Tax=Anthonomus grandis grandis TaxID=2921223 RepID=UPI0021662828|nr:uncharacterized protein LOC126737892 [Anthonomus grandis grandis]
MTSLLLVFAILKLISALPYAYPVPAQISSDYPTGLEYEGSVALNNDRNEIISPLSNVGDVVNSKINQAVNAKSIQFATPFPDSGRSSAVLETAAKESLPIQFDIKYGNLQQFVASLLHPKPIVDTIQEYEKYGNDGSKGRAFSTFVISGYEGLSNALNALVDVPFQASKTIGRQLTTSLNQVGGKLVGLA